MPDGTLRPDTGQGPELESKPRMPRWVKVFLVIAVIVALAFVITNLAGVRHGPSLHTPPVRDHTPPVQHGP